jgi:hypothetical protein
MDSDLVARDFPAALERFECEEWCAVLRRSDRQRGRLRFLYTVVVERRAIQVVDSSGGIGVWGDPQEWKHLRDRWQSCGCVAHREYDLLRALMRVHAALTCQDILTGRQFKVLVEPFEPLVSDCARR